MPRAGHGVSVVAHEHVDDAAANLHVDRSDLLTVPVTERERRTVPSASRLATTRTSM